MNVVFLVKIKKSTSLIYFSFLKKNIGKNVNGNQLKRRISGGKNHKYDVKLIKNISIGK